jgi:hypothetical protein
LLKSRRALRLPGNVFENYGVRKHGTVVGHSSLVIGRSDLCLVLRIPHSQEDASHAD